MSKNKEKHHAHESADNGRQTTDGGQRTPQDAGQPARNATPNVAGGATDLSQPLEIQDNGLPAEASAKAARQPAHHSFSEGGKVAGAAAGQSEKQAQLQDQLLRLRADFDNFRKRTLREKNELYDDANQALMLELLTVLDHLQLGIQAASAHQADPAFREGLALIFDQLMGVLSKFGLSPIETENQVFNPNRFEAVNTLPSATKPEGTVLALVRRGYMLRNKLLRPAQVIVSSGPPPEEMKNAET